jgi:arylsulfatase A-like enzyme
VLYFDLIDNEAKTAMKNKARALIMNGYKLIVKSKYSIRGCGLYDLRNDPGEMNNLQAKKRRLVNKMHAEIIKRIKENNARREKNILYIAKEGVDLKSLSKETREVLKSLGYIK